VPSRVTLSRRKIITMAVIGGLQVVVVTNVVIRSLYQRLKRPRS
jgi:hypothetical protein